MKIQPARHFSWNKPRKWRIARIVPSIAPSWKGRTGVCDSDAGTARRILEEGTRNDASVGGDHTPMRLALGTENESRKTPWLGFFQVEARIVNNGSNLFRNKLIEQK
jgi:hypothetical protein